ncbi:RES family NAD+ phosphorylase [Rhizobium ruizarguesonis]|uniref:RES family NAD+ phosphorylase n=1 Tax=Rhizobium ruizarguesonis TaxID=2081791 RepID=UPI00103AD6A3|nr:RES family NAD+ phosphorylase [Rhizobium ruizarguesonis]NEH37248.1 RES domain-containing protein [Rhizobium ruizarguesonis]NEJ32664.1 RES domain-containing protein [Rhizobium ruizarguesonis]TBY89582.1 RES domain-containing protein [Rhizobium leguminosarum bv. viciae]TCB46621.1 RES domain-containing protein [Rhizobium leguminosarum bv. viciae]
MTATDLDDSSKPEFSSYDSYRHFASRVRHERRYVWDAPVQAFVDTVLATIKDRDVELREGMVLFRAQAGIEYYVSDENQGEQPSGYGAARMKPRPNRSTEGRANPAGMPVLYLGTTEKNVISEIRPWVGAEVSVAQLKLKRKLRALDLSQGHGKSHLNLILGHILNGTPMSLEEKERAVWISIDNAFSQPVTRSDDMADYVPTQILAEVFKNAGYDAIGYKSQFGEKGLNIVLFNPDDADVINCAPYRVTGLEVSFKEIGNRWYRAENMNPSGTPTTGKSKKTRKAKA